MRSATTASTECHGRRASPAEPELWPQHASAITFLSSHPRCGRDPSRPAVIAIRIPSSAPGPVGHEADSTGSQRLLALSAVRILASAGLPENVSTEILVDFSADADLVRTTLRFSGDWGVGGTCRVDDRLTVDPATGLDTFLAGPVPSPAP